MIASVPYISPKGEATDPSEVEVLLYGLTSCDHCAAAKSLLVELAIPFAMTYMDTLDAGIRRPALAKLRRMRGEKIVFPVLEIDGEMTFGFNRDVWIELLQSAKTA